MGARKSPAKKGDAKHKNRRGRPSRSGDGQATALLSVRLTAEERALIQAAAERLDVSAAQLIRDAALRRARDVVNATGHEPALRALARAIADPLINWKAHLTGRSFRVDADKEPRHFDMLYTGSQQAQFGGVGERDDEELVEIEGVQVERPDQDQLQGFLSALETSTTEFAPILIDELRVASAAHADYAPSVRLPDSPARSRTQEDDDA